jgi:hypothetical protein
VIDAILPTAGKATRMRGLPKFLLPAGPEYLTLIERHITELLEHCETVWIPTRPEQTILLESLKLSSDRVVVVPMTTSTMTETVLRISAISAAERFLMVMPDTYFAGEKPYAYLAKSKYSISLATWKIRTDQLGMLGQVKLSETPEGLVTHAEDKNPHCEYPHSWGAMSFSKQALSFGKPEMPHTGYLLPELLEAGIDIHAREMDGSYFDCGTPAEYIEMLTSGLD